MRIAVPVSDGVLCRHFGHCTTVALFEVDPDTSTIQCRQDLMPPPHEPGVLPRWLNEQGATVIISGGMGRRAQDLFAQNGITVVVGSVGEPETIVEDYLDGRLETDDNFCDH
jgi:predicted Fe-Mo cluster-binding NifX family protein